MGVSLACLDCWCILKVSQISVGLGISAPASPRVIAHENKEEKHEPLE
jgi:hypothetical protein